MDQHDDNKQNQGRHAKRQPLCPHHYGPGVSLRAELDAARNAIEGARLLCEMLRDGHVPTVADEALVPSAQVAVLVLVAERLRSLDAVLAGDAAPSRIRARFNAVVDDVELDDDLILRFARAPQRPDGSR